MPDSITEFINVSGKTLAELQAGITLATLSATEQAVIKDVVVTSPVAGRTVSLEVGSCEVASLNAPGRLTGSEMLAPGNRLVLKTAVRALLNTIQVCDASNRLHTHRCKTLFSTDSGSLTLPLQVTRTDLPGMMVTPQFICVAANGDFYYANASSGTLYRRATGPSGAETAIEGFGLALCYDGARYIYGLTSSGQLKTLDTQTASVIRTVSLSGTFNQLTSNAHCCTIDGWVWCHPEYNAESFLVNPLDGICWRFGGNGSGSAQRYFVGTGKDRAGNYIFVQSDYTNPQLRYWSPGKTLGANPAVLFSGDMQGLSLPVYAGAANLLQRIPGIDNLLFLVGSGRIMAFDLTAMTVALNVSLTGYQGSAYGNVLSLDSARAAEDFGLIGVRATGIKVTP